MILNSCNGAQSSESNVFLGLAQQLVRASVPAIVAMQFAITDRAAIKFASEFYKVLAYNGNVEHALVMARVALAETRSNNGGLEIAEWGTPVLFLQSDSTTIFEIDKIIVPNDDDYIEESQHISGVQNKKNDKPSKPREIMTFKNREEELKDLVENNFTRATGQHFFFISAPPQMGKSLLLEELVKNLKSNNPLNWSCFPMLDVRREKNSYFQSDANAILRRFFEDVLSTIPIFTEEGVNKKACTEVAKTVINEATLCILDGAELLEDKIINQLREFLNGVINSLSNIEHGQGKATLGFVVASRRAKQQDTWKSFAYKPKFKAMDLTPFEESTIRLILKDTKAIANKHTQFSTYLYRASEGLPALLANYINWCEENLWTDVENELKKTGIFEKYIEQHILSEENLHPKPISPEKKSLAKELIHNVLLELTCFRLFTNAQLDAVLKQININYPNIFELLKQLGWDKPDLLATIKDTCFTKPTSTMAFAIHTPIRRALFRYNFPNAVEQLDAHTRAASFYDIKTVQLRNYLEFALELESFWHNVELARLSQEVINSNNSLDVNDLFQFAINWEGDIIEKYKDHLPENEIKRSLCERIENDPEIMQSLEDLPNNAGTKLRAKLLV